MAYAVEVRELAWQPVASRRLSVSPAELEAVLGEVLLEVWAAISAQQVPPAGPPFLRYHHIAETRLDVEAGFPVGAPFVAAGHVQPCSLPGGRVLVTLHAGPYTELRAAYAALAAWLEANGRFPEGAPWESYLTDPAFTPNPYDWRTEVLWPVP